MNSMRMVAAALLCVSALPALASDRVASNEVYVYPAKFQQALTPLAPLSSRVARENLCPGLAIGDDGIIHNFDIDVKMKGKGVENRRYVVTDLRLANPSGCAALDTEMARMMRNAVAGFAEPNRDRDGDGWMRLPRIQLRVVD